MQKARELSRAGQGLERESPALWQRVCEAAEAFLSRYSEVTAIDALCGIRFLERVHVEAWRQGRIERLEESIQANPRKVLLALEVFYEWAEAKGLEPVEARYVRNSRQGVVELRFILNEDAGVERLFRAHFVRPGMTAVKQEKLREKLEKAPEIVVFQVVRDSECSECGAAVDEGDMLMMEAGQPLCLGCAGLGGLEFLAAGETALTRRATKLSAKVAKVLRFSRARKRYERQGILAEPAAIEKAEESCAADAAERASARARAAEQRIEADRKLVAQMVERLGELFPNCPAGEVREIAEHTARRGSGRVGRTEAGRSLDEKALTRAVIAAVRHRHTGYDDLLAKGVDRESARRMVAAEMGELLARWMGGD